MAKYVTRDVIDQMYKLYVRPHLDYGDVIYHGDDPEINSSLDGNICTTYDGSGDFHIFTT